MKENKEFIDRMKNASIDELYREYLEALYYNNSGFVSYKDGEKEAATKDNVYLTYGEIKYEGAEKIINSVSLTENDVFLDLGSGVGKFVMQVFLSTPVKKVIGIEAHTKRYEKSLDALNLLKKDLPELFKEKGRDIDFINTNFLNFDFNKVTNIFTCSTCFSPDLMDMIGDKIDNSKNIKNVFSLKKITNLKNYELVEKLKIPCTWDEKNALCHFYRRVK